MTVYVDNARTPYRPFRGARRMYMSHLTADTRAELDAMADCIGLDRRHRHGDHYDVSQRLRRLAVQAGAIPVDRRIMAKMMIQGWRKHGRLLTPSEAEEALGWSAGSAYLAQKASAETRPLFR